MLSTKRKPRESLVISPIGRTHLELSFKVKYLEIILDSKLNYALNIEERIRKWHHASIVRPILSYGIAFWWTALSTKENCIKLDGLQRLIGIDKGQHLYTINSMGIPPIEQLGRCQESVYTLTKGLQASIESTFEHISLTT